MAARPLRRVAEIAICLSLLALVWQMADGPQALQRLMGAEPLWLAAAVAALTAQTVLSALRWRLTAAELGIALAPHAAVREYYLAQILNQSLPGGILGDAGRAIRARGQAGLLAASQSVLFERLVGQVALFVALTLAFFATLAVPGGFDWPTWLALPIASIVLAGAALPLILRVGTVLPGRAGPQLGRVFRTMAQAVAAPHVLPRQILLSTGTAVCNIAAFVFCAWAVSAPLYLTAALALVPLILFTMLIPFTISGWGVREGVAAALFPLAGATASTGLAASVAFGLMFLVATVPGLALLWLRPSEQALKQ